MTQVDSYPLFPKDPSLERPAFAFEELLGDCTRRGVTLFDIPQTLEPEIDKIYRRVGLSEDIYSSDSVKHLGPKLFSTLLNPLRALIKANHIAFGAIEQPASKDEDILYLHTDSVIREGFTVLIPVVGPDARLYHSDIRQQFPGDEIDYAVYGVGKAALLRQQIKVTDESSDVKTLPARFHGGWCTDGLRKILGIDLHVDAPLTL